MHDCILCGEVITHPICVECKENEIRTWLGETEPDLIPEFERVTDEINLSLGTTDCIICKGDMSICTYCYISHVLTWLDNYPYLINRFRLFFDPNFY